MMKSPTRSLPTCVLGGSLVVLLLACSCIAALALELLERPYIPATLLPASAHQATCKSLGGGAGWMVKTSGGDPYVQTNFAIEQLNAYWDYAVAIRYKSPAPRPDVVYQTGGEVKVCRLEVQSAGDGWRWAIGDLANREKPIEWLRLDFGTEADKNYRVGEVRLIRRDKGFDLDDSFALRSKGNDLKISQENSSSEWLLETTGADPYVMCEGLVEKIDPDKAYVLAFEYQASDEFDGFSFYYQTEDQEVHSQTGTGGPANGWVLYLHELSPGADGVGQGVRWLRIDTGTVEGQTIRIRNCRLLPATTELLQRTRIGEYAERIDSFGIGLTAVEPQQATVETVRHSGDASQSVVMSLYRHLDLDAETKRLGGDAPVPLGPRLVAGEGPHPDNHTVIRILSEYQLCEAQFLAYPPEVRGGVGVAATGDGFVAWPLACESTREIRVFDTYGGSRGRLIVPDDLAAPFSLVVADLAEEHPGDEVAVVSRYGDGEVVVLSLGGEVVDRYPLAEGTERRLVYLDGGLFSQDLSSGKVRHIAGRGKAIPDASEGLAIYPSGYTDRDYVLGGVEPLVSTLHVAKAGEVTTQDIGRMENILWVDPQEVHGGSEATWPKLADGQYIKNAKYNYLGSAQYWSPLVKSGDIVGKSHKEWVDWGEDAPFDLSSTHRVGLDDYTDGPPVVWSAGFSHRWHIRLTKALATQRDPETRLSRYLLLDRKNQPTGGGYFGDRLFDYGSQNFEQPELQKFYTACQGEFYRRLAPLYRENPEQTVAVEPNHENEIVSGHDSIGDYHPKSIEGFYHYLIARYGDLDGINRAMQTAFRADWFDAPRDLLRGSWDRYDIGNPYFRAWVEYTRVQVYRRVGTSYREALLAGFPPELIKCHQIPDRYVFGEMVGISEKEQRVSPIDWLLTTGAGFGYSRYGTFYEREENIGQGAHSSGYDGMLIGEYASLNASPEKALGQLLYLRDRGVSSLHVMWWPDWLDKGYNDAQHQALEQMLADHDTPKPGLAGGIGQLRPYEAAGYDIASLGTGEAHTGLLKSIRADGSFEGSVYTVPFHAHVGIEQVAAAETLSVGPKVQTLASCEEARQGCVVEIGFRVDSLADCDALQIETSLPQSAVALTELAGGQQIRVVYKIPVILEDVLEVSISTDQGTAKLSQIRVIQHQDQAINLTKGIMSGQRHRGGVTFDILQE